MKIAPTGVLTSDGQDEHRWKHFEKVPIYGLLTH